MMKKIIATLVVLVMSMSLLTACGSKGTDTQTPAGGTTPGATQAPASEGGSNAIDTSKEVNLVMYLYGSEGVANQDILDALNEKLKASINATLEIKYIDWGNIATQYPLLFTSGEKFDMAYVASNTAIPYATIAKQGGLVDITDMLDTYAPALKSELGTAWDSMKVDGKIYGVPSTYSEFTAYGFVTRKDLMDKINLSAVTSVEDMEKYMDAALAEGYVPLNGNSNLAIKLYHMFIDTTGEYIDAPGIPNNEMYLTAAKSTPDTIIHPAFTSEFEAFAVKMNEWAKKGYWSTDVLSGAQDDKDNFYNGLSASFISHMPDWTGNYGLQQQKLPGVESEFYPFAEAAGKIVKKMGVENATGISTTSENPERALMLIEKLMTDKECYDLFQFGILGRMYEVVDGKITKPASFNEEVDAGGFAGWALRTDKLNIPYATEDPRRYTLNEAWSKVAIDNPYVGFSFDNANVTSELSAIANVDSQLGIQIMLGKTAQDPKEAVAEYRKQLEAAGIEKVVSEVNSQLEAFRAQ